MYTGLSFVICIVWSNFLLVTKSCFEIYFRISCSWFKYIFSAWQITRNDKKVARAALQRKDDEKSALARYVLNQKRRNTTSFTPNGNDNGNGISMAPNASRKHILGSSLGSSLTNLFNSSLFKGSDPGNNNVNNKRIGNKIAPSVMSTVEQSMEMSNRPTTAKNGHIVRSASLSEGMEQSYKLGALKTGSVLTEINEKCLHESLDSRHDPNKMDFYM